MDAAGDAGGGLRPIVLIPGGAQVAAVRPVYVQGRVEQAAYGAQSAGFARSVEMGGFALATLVPARLVRRIPWRETLLVALAVLVACHLVSDQLIGTGAFMQACALVGAATAPSNGLVRPG